MKNIVLSMALLILPILSGCVSHEQPQQIKTSSSMPISEVSTVEQTQQDTLEPKYATLLYQGKASIRIVTDEGKVIYIDPYAGDEYELPADLILVTHQHFDHNDIEKVYKRNTDCRIISQEEAIQDGEYKTFDMGYVIVEAVEAGYNTWHDVNECVGYVLTLSNGKSVYVTGDTSTTKQMPLLAEKEIDYALFCGDGVYNMSIEEAAKCAEMVNAKYSIPYHLTASITDEVLNRVLAEQFEVENRLIIEYGEEIKIQ